MNFATYTTARGHKVTTTPTHVGTCVTSTGKDTGLDEITDCCPLSHLVVWFTHEGTHYEGIIPRRGLFVEEGRRMTPTVNAWNSESIDGCWLLMFPDGDGLCDPARTISARLDVSEFAGRMWLGAVAFDADRNRLETAVNVEFD